MRKKRRCIIVYVHLLFAREGNGESIVETGVKKL